MSIAVTENHKQIAVEMRDITKTFGTKVVANKNVDIVRVQPPLPWLLGLLWPRSYAMQTPRNTTKLAWQSKRNSSSR